jgi:mannose-6-phosphate isomerase-like protein (cupin superfamily)
MENVIRIPMEYIQKKRSIHRQTSPVCSVQEYPTHDKDLNLAIIELRGRYPETGWALNEQCKEIGFVIKGSGTLTTEKETVTLFEGDLVLINVGEKYFWDGFMTLIMPATPAWYPTQHKQVTL